MRHRRELQQLTFDGAPEVVATLDLSPTWGGARPGAGRKKGDNKTLTVSVRVPVEVYLRLRVGAKRSGVSAADFVRMLLDEGSQRYMPDNF